MNWGDGLVGFGGLEWARRAATPYRVAMTGDFGRACPARRARSDR